MLQRRNRRLRAQAAAPAAPPVAAAPVVPPAEVPIERYTTMRPPIPTSAIAEQAAPEPQDAFASVERLMDWISNYRKHKTPSRVPAAVHAMQDFGLFGDEEKAWFCTGFIAGVLGSNPKDGPGLIPRMFPLPDKEQAVIIRAIAYSGRPDWRELLEKNSSRMPLRRPLIDDFLAGKRPILMELPLDHGGSPGDLRAVGLLRRHRPARARGAHHAGAALVEEQRRQRLLLPQGVLGLGTRSERGGENHHRRHGEVDACLLRRARPGAAQSLSRRI